MDKLAVCNRRGFVLVITFSLFLIVNFFYFEMVRYGVIQNFFYSLVVLYHNKKKDNIKNITYTLAALIPVMVISPSSFLSFASDCMTLFLILSFVDAICYFNLTKRQEKILATVLLGYAIAFIACTLLPSFYNSSTGRYRGLFYSGNISSSVIMIVVFFNMLYYKGSKYQLLVNLIGIGCLIVALFLCNTRSIVFAIPFILWIFKEEINLKKYWPFVPILFCAGYYFIVPNADTISNDLRLSTEESSYLTRAFLYEEEFNQIMDAYLIIPHGSGSCTAFAQRITGNAAFSPHNDIIRYWYDWGILWFVILFYLYKKTKKIAIKYEFGIGALLLFIYIASCGLHNIMLYSNLWMPSIFIIWAIKRGYYKDKQLKYE